MSKLNPIHEAGRLSMVAGLAVDLRGVEWGSPAMATAVNGYLLGLTRTTAAGVVARLSGLLNLGLDAAGSPGAALQLATLQAMPDDLFAETVAQAWEQANEKPPPEGPGYVHFGGEVVLDTLRRLKSARR